MNYKFTLLRTKIIVKFLITYLLRASTLNTHQRLMNTRCKRTTKRVAFVNHDITSQPVIIYLKIFIISMKQGSQ